MTSSRTTHQRIGAAALVLIVAMSARANADEVARSTKSAGHPSNTDACQASECSTEFWIVNSRAAPKCCGLQQGYACLTFWRWSNDAGRFLQHSSADFYAAQQSQPTFLFCHGNSYESDAALRLGWDLYDRVRCVPGRKMFVLWSWPAERVDVDGKILPTQLIETNLRVKYDYAECQGYYLARLLQRCHGSHPVTLCGHSYGCALVLSALHYLGGGAMCGHCQPACLSQPSRTLPMSPLRAALLAPAIDRDLLHPGKRYGRALCAVDRLWFTYNPIDAILAHWVHFSERHRLAMGHIGVNLDELGQHAHKVEPMLVTRDLRTSHFLRRHLRADRVVQSIWQLAFH